MPGVEFVRSFLQEAAVRGVKSTVLNPVSWLIGVLLAGLAACLASTPPSWLVVALAIFIGITVVLFLVMYVYFAITSPDSLRSERFTLSKMAIEKSIKGDNLFGLIDPAMVVNARLLPTASLEPKEVDK